MEYQPEVYTDDTILKIARMQNLELIPGNVT